VLDSVLIAAQLGTARDSLIEAFGAELGPGTSISAFADQAELLTAVSAALQIGSGRLLVVLSHSHTGDANDPLSWVPNLRETHPFLPIIAVAGQANVELVGTAIGAGASDFLVQGAHLQERIATLLGKLRGLIEVLERNRRLGANNERLWEERERRFEMIGKSPRMETVREQVERVAVVPRPVLVIGERGTGKELVARAIHRHAMDAIGARPTPPMIAVNCAALSENLLESELFGHQAGAFTGADQLRTGRFEQARDGSLFLDEIGCMSLAFQQKILRVVEYGTFNRVGGSEEHHSNARIIAATNADLKELISEGSFLSDLYDRLAFEEIEVPPLRARSEDIAPLAEHILEQFAREIPAFRGKTLSAASLRALARYSFPGNVRELKNLIERAAYRGDDASIEPEDIGLPTAQVALPENGSFRSRVSTYQRSLIEAALEAHEGNGAAAARSLEMTYDQFRHYARKLLS
jgi:psp operon transcriptional activator